MLLVPNLLWGKETKTNPDESFDNSKNESEKLISSDKESPNTTLNNSGDADTYSSPRKVERKDILKVFYTYYEARLCKPRLGKLNELLQLTKYSGPEYEYNIDKSLLVTLDHLNDVIQASDMEILKGLEDLQAIEMDGFYRVLSFDYEFRCLSFMLDLIDENSWSLDRISKNETMRLLKDLFPGVLISKLFDYYTLKTVVEGEEQFYKYKEEKVCRFLARVLLKSAGKFNLDDFLQAWKDSVPDGMTTDVKIFLFVI